jgi:hypothetical protein
MSQQVKIALSLLLAIFLNASAVAQNARSGQPAKSQAQEAEAEDKSREKQLALDQQRALALLDQLSEAAQEMENGWRKVRVQAQIANLLWAYDEAQARHQFEEAFQAIAAIKTDDHFSSPYEDRGLQLRREVLGMIIPRDAELARRLVESVPEEAPNQSSGKASNEREQLRQEITQRLANLNPQPPASLSSSPGAMETSQEVSSQLSTPLPSEQQSSSPVASRENRDLQEVWQAVNEGEFDRALSLLERMRDATMRAELDSLVRTQAAMMALEKADYAAAYRHAQALSDATQRAFLFAHLAQALRGKKDFARAIEVLTEAERLSQRAEGKQEKVHALLVIASTMASLDTMRGFEILQTAIEAMNRGGKDERTKLAAAFELDRSSLEQSFALLARADFDRAWRLAQTIERKEVSVEAQLAMCLGVLARSSEP